LKRESIFEKAKVGDERRRANRLDLRDDGREVVGL
jgi:hypothetical protein